jgi:hypothetical protein
MKISVELTEMQRAALAATAERLLVAPDELAAAAVRDLLAQPAEDFSRAAERVLEKNRELYRRLA